VASRKHGDRTGRSGGLAGGKEESRQRGHPYFGSRTTWNGLLAQGVIDELHLMVGPAALLGEGTPLFDAPVALALLDARRFAGSSNVLLRYAVQR
jgi:dihydrofolate reductase